MERDVQLAESEIRLPSSGIWARLPMLAGGIGSVALVAGLALGFGDRHSLAESYLTGFLFWWTLALGGLFFTILHYLARSGWSVVVRRLAENVAATLPLFALLFIGFLLLDGVHELYHWSHADAVAADPLLQHKAPYLNMGFFLARAGFYFAIWLFLAWYFCRGSRRQDADGDPAITRRLQVRSAPAMVAFGVTLNFAAMDWIMTLDPHWFSTIFGVYVFAGCVVAIFATLILLVLQLQAADALKTTVTWEHFHDMGKMLFGFVVFWAYIGFSQFMLIWYGNIPEETAWYDHRWQHGWEVVSVILAAGHFGLPFLFLLPQAVKRRRSTLTLAALWLLLMHALDIFWLVIPTFRHSPHVTLTDLLVFVGFGGLFVGVLAWRMGRQPLVPLKDPRLAESLAFEQV